MLLQIHDELLFEIPDEAVENVVPRIAATMEGVWDLAVPLTVEIGQGEQLGGGPLGLRRKPSVPGKGGLGRCFCPAAARQRRV